MLKLIYNLDVKVNLDIKVNFIFLQYNMCILSLVNLWFPVRSNCGANVPHSGLKSKSKSNSKPSLQVQSMGLISSLRLCPRNREFPDPSFMFNIHVQD